MAEVDFSFVRDDRHRSARAWPDIQAFLAWKELGGTSPRTLQDYEWTLARLLRAYPTLALADFTDVELAKVLRTHPARGRRTKKAAYDSLFKWAIKTRRLDRNPMDLLPTMKRPDKKVIEVFSPAEVAILDSIPGENGVLFQILFDCGLRRGEARRLQRRDVLLDRKILAIRGSKGGKDRVVPLTRELHKRLSAWFQHDNLKPQAYLWATRPGGHHLRRDTAMGDTSFLRWYTKALDEAGVPYKNPHVTRHTFATHWLRRGGRLETLSRVMGHASIRTTFDLYGHLDLSDIERDLRLVEGEGKNCPDETRMDAGKEATSGFEPLYLP